MSTLATVLLAIGTLVLGWLLNEWSHRQHVKDEDRRELARSHRANQTAALVALQQKAIEYHTNTQRLLTAAFDSEEDPHDREAAAAFVEACDASDRLTTELFAARAHVDDLRIRSFVDFLAEMARQFIDDPGVIYVEGRAQSRSVQQYIQQGVELEGILVRLSNYIGSRQLDLVGVMDPEVPPYRGE